MKRKLLLAALGLILVLTGCARSTAAPPTLTPVPTPAFRTELGSIDTAVDQRVRTLMERGDIPSLSAGIVVDGELVWAKNYDGPAGLDTAYLVGSIQKPFTASAVLQLYEQGLLDLDEDVSAYLDFPVKHPEHPETPITVRMLLTHQSGLGDTTAYLGMFNFDGDYALYEFGEELLGITFPRFDATPTRAAFFEGLLTPGGAYYTPDVWEATPGTVSYSNIGYVTLGYIVERVSGQPFAQYLVEQIMEPLGMDHSGYRVSELRANHALPHERVEGDYLYLEGERVPILEGARGWVQDHVVELPLYEHTPGAGGLRTTVPDLAQFMIAHMNEGRAPNGFQLLGPQTVEMMHQSAGPSQGNINSFELVGQGMGWSVCEDQVQGHVGGQAGFGGTMVFKRTPQGSIGILLMINVAGTYLEDSPRFSWFKGIYFPLEQLLFQTGEQIMAQQSTS